MKFLLFLAIVLLLVWLYVMANAPTLAEPADTWAEAPRLDWRRE